MIPRWLQGPLFQWTSERTIRYISPSPGADPLSREVLAQARRDFFVGGPITVHASSPMLMAGMWMAGRETILVDGVLDRAAKEVIAAGVSQANRCPYCVDMHVSMAHGTGRHTAADLILMGTLRKGETDEGRRLAEWALSSRKADADVVRRPPFPSQAIPEAVGTAFFFHYINRVVNVFFSDRPLPLPSVLEGARPRLVRIFGTTLRESLTRLAEPGLSLSLLPSKSLPRDLAWASTSPNVAHALACWDGAIAAAGTRYVTSFARERLRRTVMSWNGEDPPLGTRSFADALDGLDDSERPWAKLALTAALASYRVPPELVARVRQIHGEDKAIVAAVAWGSFAAAKRIAGWLSSGAEVMAEVP